MCFQLFWILKIIFQKSEQQRLKSQQEDLLYKNQQEEQNAIAVKEQKIIEGGSNRTAL